MGGLAKRSFEELRRVKGIGEAKALLLFATIELGARLNKHEWIILKNDTAVYYLLSPYFKELSELQYQLVLMSEAHEILATVEARGVLPDTWVTWMAIEAGAKRLMIARNGWMRFSGIEHRYFREVTDAAGMLGLIVQGMMALGVYFGETDHPIPWQTDHLNCWRKDAANAVEAFTKIVI